MKKVKAGIRSTKRELAQALGEEENRHKTLPKPKKYQDIMFQVLDTTDELAMRIYTDQTGRFPKRSSKGNQYIMVLCEIDSDAILVEPMRDRTSGEMI